MKKSTSIILTIAALAVLIAAALYLIVGSGPTNGLPGATSSQNGVTLPFEEIAHGERSEITVRKSYLVTSASELTALWRLIDTEGQPPTIDFTKESVVAVFAGKKSTAGYDIKVTQVTDSVSRMVTITLTNPGGSCLLAQTETAPYHIVRVPLTALALTHEDKIVTTSCL